MVFMTGNFVGFITPWCWCRRFGRTKEVLLLVLGHKGLLQGSGTSFLLQKLQLRAPYVTPLNILQVCFPANLV